MALGVVFAIEPLAELLELARGETGLALCAPAGIDALRAGFPGDRILLHDADDATPGFRSLPQIVRRALLKKRNLRPA